MAIPASGLSIRPNVSDDAFPVSRMYRIALR